MLDVVFISFHIVLPGCRLQHIYRLNHNSGYIEVLFWNFAEYFNFAEGTLQFVFKIQIFSPNKQK